MIALKNGKIITIAQGVIEGGTVLIENGKIKAVGADLPIPAGCEVIDVTGKWVTPGFIDAHTHISTFGEPAPMPGMPDGNEMTSPNTAQVRAIDALNPHDIAIEAARRAGFTTCFTGPGSANVVCGTGISFKTKPGETVFDIIYAGSEQMKMALGENPKRVYGADKKLPQTRMGVGAVLREALFDAKAYSDKLIEGESDPSKKPAPNFKLEALVPVVRGQMKARIHCHRADDIVTAVRIAEEFGLQFAIEHATESYKITEFLAKKGAVCVVGPLTMSPMKMEIWYAKLETPGILEKKGIPFCLTEDTASGTKWLPMHIGLCIARGLSEEAAFRAVTINPAKLLGVDARVGSIEPGKDADLAVWSGNPFCNMTLCEKTMIDGVLYGNA